MEVVEHEALSRLRTASVPVTVVSARSSKFQSIDGRDIGIPSAGSALPWPDASASRDPTPWSATVVGTVTLDEVTTADGSHHYGIGGSGLYAAMAAARYVPVHLVGAVGRDATAALTRSLRGLAVDAASVDISDLPNFWWRAQYEPRTGETIRETYSEGPYAGWHPRMSPAARSAQVLFLGALRPDLQSEVLGQTQSLIIGADSRQAHFDDRARLLSVVRGVDVLFLNRREVALLTGRDTDAWLAAAVSLIGFGRLRLVVVKGGPHGAACVWRGGALELPAAPVTRVRDPTGAGDALAGGFLGSCARARRFDPRYFPVALREGLECAAAAIARVGTSGLAAAVRPSS